MINPDRVRHKAEHRCRRARLLILIIAAPAMAAEPGVRATQ
ncbi:MAG: hypothetical protein V4653_16785 [Pseudomonadota bacterium]